MPGEVVNLSELGMAVETLIDLPPGYELTFRLRRNGGYVELRGWIRWSRSVRTISTSQGKELKVFHSGVEFDQATVTRLRDSSEVMALTAGEANGAAHEGVVELLSPGK
jgi:hypothetical protein